MSLGTPPKVAALAALATRWSAGLTLHRVYRAHRTQPWFFAGLDAGADPAGHGRFDLPLPDGACYAATSAVAAELESFQHLVACLVAEEELRARRRAQAHAPASSPVART